MENSFKLNQFGVEELSKNEMVQIEGGSFILGIIVGVLLVLAFDALFS